MRVLVYFLVLLACFSQGLALYENCDHVIVGAGIGGIYTAHQLANTSAVPIDRICIFEYNSRPGGRIFSLRSEDGRLMVDLGGADYLSGGNLPVMDSIKDAFGLHTVCSYYLDPDCGDNGQYFSFLRNHAFVNQKKGTRKSSTLPYYLLPNEQYSTKAEFVSPYDLLDDQLPILAVKENDLESSNKQKAWKAMKDIFTYMYLNNVPATDLSYWETDFRTALYNVTTGAPIKFSEEKWATILQAVDEAEYDSPDWIYHASKYALFSEELFGSGDGSEVVFSDADGNPVGYATALETLLANFTLHGGRIFFNHRITTVRRPTPYDNQTSEKFILEGVMEYPQTGLFKIKAKTVVLNTGAQDLNRLSRNSVMWTEADFDFNYLLNCYGTTVAQKGFLHYQDPWWYRILNQTANAVTTDEPLHYFENFQSWPDCDVETFKTEYCPAWTQVAYTNGLQYIAYWESANLNRTSAPIWLSPDDPVTAPFLLDAHQQFVAIYADLLEDSGIDPETIDPPDRGVFAYWEGGWSYVKTNVLGGRHNRMMRKPLQMEGSPSTPGDQLCIINTDFSGLPGDAEGSLVAALEALLLCYNVTVPNFPRSFYNNIVSQVF